jgi:SpoVK/Ycf46/Vps4 family AAA+-type ATPase
VLTADGDMGWLAAQTERYSGSDLRALCHEAAMGAIREHGAKIASIKASALRPVQRRDFEAALQVIRPSVSAEQAAELDEWARKHGTRA